MATYRIINNPSILKRYIPNPLKKYTKEYLEHTILLASYTEPETSILLKIVVDGNKSTLTIPFKYLVDVYGPTYYKIDHNMDPDVFEELFGDLSSHDVSIFLSKITRVEDNLQAGYIAVHAASTVRAIRKQYLIEVQKPAVLPDIPALSLFGANDFIYARKDGQYALHVLSKQNVINDGHIAENTSQSFSDLEVFDTIRQEDVYELTFKSINIHDIELWTKHRYQHEINYKILNELKYNKRYTNKQLFGNSARISFELSLPNTEYTITLAIPYTYIDATNAPSAEEAYDFIPTEWGPDQQLTIQADHNYIANQIRTRYAMFERPISGLSNIIVDSFVPHLMYDSRLNYANMLNNLNIPKTSVAISHWFANLLNIRRVPTNQLCHVLGFTPTDIKQLFRKVRAQKLDITFVGMGGTSINTIYWLHEMAQMTNSINLFNSIVAYEPDTIEFSNLLRFPIDPTTCLSTYNSDSTTAPSKLDLIKPYLPRLSTDEPVCRQTYYHATPSPSRILYGAPDIETRTKLSEYGNFISATHASNGCRIDLNPAQDTSLQVESYGLISLGGFFMNQLRMAIRLLEYLATAPDLSAKDQTILEYEFDGTTQIPTDRQYNFQLEHSGLMMVETTEGALNA